MFTVKFHHDDVKSPNVTKCTVKDGRKLLGKSEVKRYFKDTPDKKKAEMYSLVKALDSSRLDYKDKTLCLLTLI